MTERKISNIKENVLQLERFEDQNPMAGTVNSHARKLLATTFINRYFLVIQSQNIFH